MATTKYEPGDEVAIKTHPHIMGRISKIEIRHHSPSNSVRIEYYIGGWPQAVPERYIISIAELAETEADHGEAK